MGVKESDVLVLPALGYQVKTPPGRSDQEFLRMLAKASEGHMLNGDSLALVIKRHLERNAGLETVSVRDIWLAADGDRHEAPAVEKLLDALQEQRRHREELQAGVDSLVEAALARNAQVQALGRELEEARSQAQAASEAMARQTAEVQSLEQLRTQHRGLGDAMMEISGWAESMGGGTHWAVRTIRVALQSHAPDAVTRYLERLRISDDQGAPVAASSSTAQCDPAASARRTGADRSAAQLDHADFVPFDAQDNQVEIDPLTARDSVFDVSGVDVPLPQRQRAM